MERVGFVGLGTMGAAMAANICPGRVRAHRLEPHPSGRAADWPASARPRQRRRADLARDVDVIVICVSDTPDVEDVLFRGRRHRRGGAGSGTLVIDCSTDLAVGQTRGFGERLAEQGVHLVDAPVSGGSEGAQKGTLTIFVGGDAADVERAPAGPRGDGQDDHAPRAARQRPGRRRP